MNDGAKAGRALESPNGRNWRKKTDTCNSELLFKNAMGLGRKHHLSVAEKVKLNLIHVLNFTKAIKVSAITSLLHICT